MKTINVTIRKYITLAIFILFSAPIISKAEGTPQLKIGNEEDYIRLEGALRFNYIYSNWQKHSKKKGGELGFETFILGLDAAYKKLLFSMEYRFYTNSLGGGMLRQGYIGYKHKDAHQLQFGLNSVPFGILPYNSNSWFLSINYYLGLELDSDMGVKYSYATNKWDVDVAFYKNSDILDFNSSNTPNASRFSYDIGGENREVNQGNARIVYKWGQHFKQKLGASALLGGLYNVNTENTTLRSTVGVHYTLEYKNLNLKLMALTYKFKPKSAYNSDELEEETLKNETVRLTAYGSSYNIAARADVYTAGISYKFPLEKKPFNSIEIYNDFGYQRKYYSEFHNSFQNITGAKLSVGPILIFMDHAIARNHSWLGPEWENAFSTGHKSNRVNYRLNLNLGYYF